ncbi:MAG: type II secretion system protein GspC [Polyangiaceae bacterium]
MALDQVLKRHFWIVTVPLTALAAFFGAVGVTQLAVAPPTAKELAVAPLSARGASATMLQPAVHSTNADAILSRNPFDSVTGPLNKVEIPESETPQKGPDMTDPANAPACDGVKVLVITASSDPEWSFAAMQGTGENKTVLRRRGGEVGGKKVEYVGWDRVWMSSGSTLCQAQMFKPGESDKPKATTPAVAEAPAPSRGGAPPVGEEYKKGIQKISANEYNVDRGVVDKILENQADLMRQARIVPEQENGKIVGIRLFGVRSDTLLGVLGMENGDRLQAINGFEVASPEKALEAYARLRTADKLTVQVNRRGQNMNLDYNIK